MAEGFERGGGQLVGPRPHDTIGYAPSPRDVDYWTVPVAEEFEERSSTLDLRGIWEILAKRKLLIAAATLTTLALGIIVTLLMTPIYTAKTTLQIDREAARIVSGQDVQPQEQMGAVEEFFQTQYGLMKSQSLAQRVVQVLGLARDEKFLRAMHVKAIGSTPAKRQEQAVKTLSDHLGVSPVRGSRLAVLTFDSPSPELSAQIVNAVAENYISSNLERRFESSSYARDFLEKRLAQVKAKLEDTERQLVAYASAQQIITLSERERGGDPNQTQSLQQADLSALNGSLASAKASRIAAEQRWRQAQTNQEFGASEVLNSPTIQKLNQNLAQLQADYQDKLRVYKPDFPIMVQLKAQIDETSKQVAQETSNIKSSVAQSTRTSAFNAYQIAANEERALQQKVSGLKGDVLDVRGRSIQYNILQREVDTNRQLYDGLLQRYKEVGVAGGVTANNLSIVDRAEAPRTPSKPRPAFNAALSILLGLGIGIGGAFLLEALDQAIRRPTDIESRLGIPLLGTVPRLEKGVTPLEALGDIRSDLSEAYLSLTTALQFSSKSGLPTTLLVTSSRQSEGKTSSAYAIAQNFARIGKKALIIDGDLRNPSLHKLLGVEHDRHSGTSSLLVGAASLLDCVIETSTPGLWAIPSGPMPPNPAELLAGGRLRSLLAEAENEFDLVVVDGPPILGLADAPIISSLVQGTVLVVEAGGVGFNQVRASLRRLRMARAKLIGVLMTKFNAKQGGYSYSYAYEYSYGSRLPQPKHD